MVMNILETLLVIITMIMLSCYLILFQCLLRHSSKKFKCVYHFIPHQPYVAGTILSKFVSRVGAWGTERWLACLSSHTQQTSEQHQNPGTWVLVLPEHSHLYYTPWGTLWGKQEALGHCWRNAKSQQGRVRILVWHPVLQTSHLYKK